MGTGSTHSTTGGENPVVTDRTRAERKAMQVGCLCAKCGEQRWPFIPYEGYVCYACKNYKGKK